MVIRRNMWILGVGSVMAAALAACGQQSSSSTGPSAEEKTFNLTPANASVKASFLTGQLQDLKVVERVEQGTGKVTEPPRLHATLKLKNASQDQSARLLSGKIEYMDKEGKPIALAEGRRDTSFSLPSYQSDRLDPGKDVSQDIDVPFPSTALKEKRLRDIRLDLTYIPMPYKEETVEMHVSLGG
jgi:hypothetical protein